MFVEVGVQVPAGAMLWEVVLSSRLWLELSPQWVGNFDLESVLSSNLGKVRLAMPNRKAEIVFFASLINVMALYEVCEVCIWSPRVHATPLGSQQGAHPLQFTHFTLQSKVMRDLPIQEVANRSYTPLLF